MNKPQQDEKMRRSLPFVIEFVKFSAGFSLLIVGALVMLHVAGFVR